MSYNSYFPGSQQLIWVQGKEGADGFLIAPNNTVPLWDMEEPVIYLKSADSMGRTSIKILDYTEREIPNPTDELSDLRSEVSELKEMIKSLTKGKKKNEPSVSTVSTDELE